VHGGTYNGGMQVNISGTAGAPVVTYTVAGNNGGASPARMLTSVQGLGAGAPFTSPGVLIADKIPTFAAVPLTLNGVSITPFEVKHPSGAPPYASRFQLDGKVIAFTGDTGWTESLCAVGQGADLLISECFQYDVTLPIHLDYKTIDANYERLGAKRVLLTHMGEAMLAQIDKVDTCRYLVAQDGMTLDL
jgi:ribonuclease BN (tRNA processing enzyme)